MIIRNALSILVLMLIAATEGATANAQVDTYNFTGTISYGKVYNAYSGSFYFFNGQSFTGQVTLDRGDTPDYVNDLGSPVFGQYGEWTNDGFSVNLDVAGLGAFGSDSTEAGGTTYYWNEDHLYNPYLGTEIKSSFIDGAGYSSTDIFSYSYYTSAANGVAEVANPWDLMTEQNRFGNHSSFDPITGDYLYFQFTIENFERMPTTIVIDGRDTGIDDFEFNGELASALIMNAASGAKNSGQFVSSVAKLANAWKNAGLITNSEKNTIMTYATQSSVGKH